MPSKLSIHVSGFGDRTYEMLQRIQPSVVKVFNVSSEQNIDEIKRRCPNTVIIYRQYTLRNYWGPADDFYNDLKDTLVKLKGRGILWEGLNEPVIQNINEAQALNAWYVRFAQLMHAQGELVAGFSWSTGNPVPSVLSQTISYMVDAAAACDVHAFHEYYNRKYGTQDWARYRVFEQALPAHARKPVIITEAGFDDDGNPYTGGYRGKITDQQYLDLLKQYDAVLMQDPYVLGATVYQWGDYGWPSFEIDPMMEIFSQHVLSIGQGVVLPKPWPLPAFATDVPTYTFFASPYSVVEGQSSTLTWDAENVTALFLDGQQVPLHGTRIVSPTQNTTYTLRVLFMDGTSKEVGATVSVVKKSLEIVSVTFSPTNLKVGELLTVSVTVKNGSTMPIETQGPEPGFEYNEGDTFYSRNFPDVASAYRIGVDFDGRAGVDHPYRWGLGTPLAPDETRTITGTIRVKNPNVRNYWVGAVQEQVAWFYDRQGTQSIKVLADQQPRITAVTFSPTTLNTGDVLNVSVTVRNDSSQVLSTQEPDPGFMYQEGQTFYTPGFPETRGAYRIGVDFDGRTGVDHPYRWGLGSPLQPGETRTVTGSIKLATGRTARYWAGMVREGVQWIDDQSGVQSIVVQQPPPTKLVELTAVTFSPLSMDVDKSLRVSFTVRNNSTSVIGTQGPVPDFEYIEGETFLDRGFPDVKGAFRVGVDFDGRTGVDHPYRWGLGSPLQPGETRTINGTIRLRNEKVVRYWGGLVQEQTAWVQDVISAQAITVASTKVVQLTAVTFFPLKVNTDEFLQIIMTVKNPTTLTLPTSGPDPGFVYVEGENFDSRGFPATRGNVRVGIDFDGRTGIDHPFRWGLGSPLQPGETRTISGYIRLKQVQTKNYWAGLVEELIAWRQDRQGTQQIAVVRPP